jgi:Fur family transcriptional regulator, iron response regulator
MDMVEREGLLKPNPLWPQTDAELQQRLQEVGILPTLQRMAIAAALLSRPCHMTADQVLTEARRRLPSLSRTTVYGALDLFVRKGLLRELPVQGESAVYDSNPVPHHHLYNMVTREVQDLPAQTLQVLGMADLGADLEVVDVDLIVRVRPRGHSSRPARRHPVASNLPPPSRRP